MMILSNSLSPITIRRATPADIDTIALLTVRMATGLMLPLEPHALRHGLQGVLGNPSRGAYHLAVAGGHVVGQVSLAPVWDDWNGTYALWLDSLYAEPQGLGVGRSLVQHAIAAAPHEGARAIRLEVPDGEAAERLQRFYESLGFRRTGVAMERGV